MKFLIENSIDPLLKGKLLVQYRYDQLALPKIANFNIVISWPESKVNTISIELSNN